MKTNKKAFLGFAVAVVFSLAFAQGSKATNNQNMNIQQLSLSTTMMSNDPESGIPPIFPWDVKPPGCFPGCTGGPFHVH